MVMGLVDWHGPNRITAQDQEVMRHATSMVTRVVRRLFLLEDRVSAEIRGLSMASDFVLSRLIRLRTSPEDGMGRKLLTSNVSMMQ